MSDVKKIALIICASNFESQKNAIKNIHQKLKEMGNYALYVLTCYGIFRGEQAYEEGAASIYSLLEEYSFDGCIIEGNIGNERMVNQFAEQLTKRNIPFVTLNIGIGNHPYVISDATDTCEHLLKHLIEVHGCKKINLVKTPGEDIYCIHAVQVYKDTLAKYAIPFEEERIVTQIVSIPNGREAYHIFKERGVEDADATVCMHDVLAMGLCLELEAHGLSVPQDMRICAFNRSVNSMVFRPDITSADRMDIQLAAKTCEVLEQLMEGKDVPGKNYVKAKVFMGSSCGCTNIRDNENKHYQDVVLAKVEAGNQISQMMNYNDSLEGVVSLEELGDNVKAMMLGINCSSFIFCLNQRAIEYITSASDYVPTQGDKYFDDTMTAVIGVTERTGELKDYEFPLQELAPIEAKAGDLLLFMPIHHQEQVYGYMVFVNEYLPVELYNYRICHESLGSSMVNLHRHMVMRQNIRELDELHMRDALTGLYNRFAWRRYGEKYFEKKKYTIVMLDVDSLKTINDSYGHLAGNNAISITAKVIQNATDEDDLVIRYGGDEFQIISHNVDAEYWEEMKRIINRNIAADVAQQELSYDLGVSMGYAICDEAHPMTVEECCEKADQAMYADKATRKVGR